MLVKQQVAIYRAKNVMFTNANNRASKLIRVQALLKVNETTMPLKEIQEALLF